MEEHFTTREVMADKAKWQKPVELTEEEKKIRDFFSSCMFLTDTDRQRLTHNDSLGVKMQILSYTTPVTDHILYSEDYPYY